MAQTHLSPPGYLWTANHPSREVRSAQAILRALFGPPHRRAFAVRYWDGSVDPAGSAGTPVFTAVLRRPGALRRMLFPPSELSLGEAYLRDDFDVEGDFEAAVRAAMDMIHHLSPLQVGAILPRLLDLPADDLGSAGRGTEGEWTGRGRMHSRDRDAGAIRHHYDVGNAFYQIFLDRRLVYSCAYFPTGREDLDAAQAAKLDHICRKLRLKRGERLLDIGCGWGGLIQFAAEHYGVQALGVTLSHEQASLARERIATAGLTDRCRVELSDYRDLSLAHPFDKVVSVGMFEHVGESQMPTYFGKAFRLTRPGGLFLNHGIVTAWASPQDSVPLAVRPFWRPNAFIHRYVFPDGELMPASAMLTYAERAGFEVRDVENLREHYAQTLRHWVRRLEAQHEHAARLVGEKRYRVWRLYMAASADGFRAGRNSLVQALFSRPTDDGAAELPATRADLYQTAAAPV